jgi:prevent-host-death family protein
MPKTRPAPLATVRNRQGEPTIPASFTATDAKKEFGRVLDRVMRDGVVVITKHAAPRAFILSVEEYAALAQAPQRQLDALSAEFDAMFAGMQTPVSRAGMKAAFAASPKELGKAAVRAARRRG